MKMPAKVFLLLNVHMRMSHCSFTGESYFVTLSDNGPVVLGANVTFKAELFTPYGTPPSGTFRFRWRDNAIPAHFSEVSCRSVILMYFYICVCVHVCVHTYIPWIHNFVTK
jgi:hypothetical protein